MKRYADVATAIVDAARAFAEEVREHRFPEVVHTYGMSDEELGAFHAIVGNDRALEAER